MKSKKLQTIFFNTIVFFCLAAAVALLIVSGQGEGYRKVLGIICGSLLLILSILIFFYWWTIRKDDPNFFLYDRRTQRNIPLDKLTETMVVDRMTFFIDQIADSPELLWSGNVLERNNNFGHRGMYRPLVAYKMLYDLGEQEPDSPYWNYLANASDDNLGILCAALERAGEKKMVQAFRLILQEESKPGKQMKDFLRRNVPYFRARMLDYVKKYIDCFY